MPNLDHNGPGNLGPKTERKLGKCRKTKLDNIEDTEKRPFVKRQHKNRLKQDIKI